MWEYNYSGDCPENNEIDQSDELMHYGVKGMRWGVRRATKILSKASSSDAKRKDAIESLAKHKIKGQAKVDKLQKKRIKLDNKLDKATNKDRAKADKWEAKATKLDYKAVKKKNKAYGGLFVSDERRKALIDEATVLEGRAKALHAKANMSKAKYEKAKNRVEANERMTQAFQTELNKIDEALVKHGRRYLNG